MFDIESIIKKHVAEDGSIPAEAVAKLAQAVNSSVGREFVEKARYTDKLTEIETLKTEKQTAEDSATTAGKWKDKYDALHGEFEDFKKAQTAKETKAARVAATRAYYESKGFSGKALDIAMRASKTEIDALELDGDKIKDSAALDALVTGDLAELVKQPATDGGKVKVSLGGSLGGGTPDTGPTTLAGALMERYEKKG